MEAKVVTAIHNNELPIFMADRIIKSFVLALFKSPLIVTKYAIISGLFIHLTISGCSSSHTSNLRINSEPVISTIKPQSVSTNCLAEQVIELAAQPIIYEAVQTYNSKPTPLITDSKWTDLDINTPPVTRLTQNLAAKSMTDELSRTTWQGEGILIGLNGGLVAITAKTTDFWQQDEPQFNRAIHLPKGDTYIQKKVIDTSSQLMLIKISTPVFAPETNKPLGVLVVGFDQFVVEFNKPCKK